MEEVGVARIWTKGLVCIDGIHLNGVCCKGVCLDVVCHDGVCLTGVYYDGVWLRWCGCVLNLALGLASA